MISQDPAAAADRPFGGVVLAAASAAAFVFLSLEISMTGLIWAVFGKLDLPTAALVVAEVLVTLGLLIAAVWFFRRCLRSERNLSRNDP